MSSGGVLQVGVDGDDGVSGGEVEPGGDGGFFAEVAGEVDHLDIGVLVTCCLEGVQGAVAAAVVDTDDFEVVGCQHGRQGGLDLFKKGLHVAFFVVEGGNQGDFFSGIHVENGFQRGATQMKAKSTSWQVMEESGSRG